MGFYRNANYGALEVNTPICPQHSLSRRSKADSRLIAASIVNCGGLAMTGDDFRQLVAIRTDTDLLGPCLREDLTPYVFDPRPDTWVAFRTEVSEKLGVEQADIRIVGSGRFGFSLKPGNNLKAYSDKSDVDVVVINPEVFDLLWCGLLKAAYPRPPVTQQVGGWLKIRQNEVYTGWLSPLEVRLDRRIFGLRAQAVLDFNARWFNTFKSASRHVPRRHEDINVRLYRTWDHADMYHHHSIASLRKALAA